MKLTIDNLDGLGSVDYSAALDRSQAVKIERRLNAPSTVSGVFCLDGSGLASPVRRARVEIASDAGVTLFTGYLATEPVPVYAGAASEGSVYRFAFRALSDEWLLDKLTAGSLAGGALSAGSGQVLSGMTDRAAPGLFVTTGVTDVRVVGVLPIHDDLSWSGQAGALASASYAAYRALNGVLTLAPAGSVVHALSDGDGSLSVAGLRASPVKELANDVTVSGEMEPAAYWIELFMGDGTTAQFNLAGEPDALNKAHAILADDSFNGTSFNLQQWMITDPGSHLSLSGNGLALSGGNGFDGQTVISAWDQVELGGALVMELAGVSLASGSAGIVGGLYQGAILQANCFAGFNVRQAAGSTAVTPMVNGVETGTTFTFNSGHSYTLRLRAYSPELLRVRQSFYAMAEASGTLSLQQFGGGLVEAPVSLIFEVRDEGSSSNTPVTILYDGQLPGSPALTNLGVANSVRLYGTIGHVSLKRTGTAWVRSANATTVTGWTRLAGTASQGVDCELVSSVTGHVTFWPGRIPAAGEYVTVSYRGQRRAVARLADAASIAAEANGGGVGTARWLGKILSPGARSADDCESAAQAILSFSTNRAAAVSGTYVAINPDASGDIWPGDVLALSQGGTLTSVIVRSVTVEEHGAAAEVLTYHIAFANDWAEGLGMKLSEAIAVDALLPPVALELAPGAAAPVLANLQQMTVTPGISTLTVDAGTAPPLGGGFEVRRRDGGFGNGATGTGSGDLVLRSPVREFTIPRAAAEETFFVRMYDASTPPLYSRESSAIVTHLPIS